MENIGILCGLLFWGSVILLWLSYLKKGKPPKLVRYIGNGFFIAFIILILGGCGKMMLEESLTLDPADTFLRYGLAMQCLRDGDTAEGRTAADNATVRNVFIIGPDKKIKLVLVYPMTTGRNFQEILRVIDSLQMTAKHRVATPADWKQGEDVIIAGSVTDDEAKTIYPQGWKSPKPYIRIVPQPK